MKMFLEDALREFHQNKVRADRAVSLLTDAELHLTLDPASNSVAVIMKHVAGNMRSRWTDFLTSDGEKPDRNRDLEFEPEPDMPRNELLLRWDAGWRLLFSAMDSLRPQDLERTVRIRGEPHTVSQAILRQIGHYSYHVGQIIFLAKHLAGDRWKPLTIPKGKSEEFAAAMRQKYSDAEEISEP
jgi:hypothetical protein